MLATGTSKSIAIFIYDTIRSGSGAQVGFNAGDGRNFFTLPGALTSQTLAMEELSNIGEPGVFIYRIDSKLLQ